MTCIPPLCEVRVNLFAKLYLRSLETASVFTIQAMDLNKRLVKGEITPYQYAKEVSLIWSYNINNFWHPSDDVVLSSKKLAEDK